MWWLYMIRCADQSLYTGIATDVSRRFNEHQAQGPKAARYLRGRGPLELVFAAPVPDRSEAQRLEYRIKQLPRADKLRLLSGALSWQALMSCTNTEARTNNSHESASE
jgi:putative endonuclease